MVSRTANSSWAGSRRATATGDGRGDGLCCTPRSGASTTSGWRQDPSTHAGQGDACLLLCLSLECHQLKLTGGVFA